MYIIYVIIIKNNLYYHNFLLKMTEFEIKACECRKGGYSHCKKHLRYHIIFVTKYRRKCLNQIKDEVFDAFRYVESKSHIKIHTMNLDTDHIHLIISFPTIYSIEQTVSRLKQMTTNYLYRNERTCSWLKNFYWKKKRLLWTRGYFVSTIGHISEKIVFEYIENQGKNYYIN